MKEKCTLSDLEEPYTFKNDVQYATFSESKLYQQWKIGRHEAQDRGEKRHKEVSVDVQRCLDKTERNHFKETAVKEKEDFLEARQQN